MKEHKCDICGRLLFKKNRYKGYTLCSKHMHQLHKYGRFLDNIQRTNSDKNDYKINYKDKTVTFNLYNQKNQFIKTFIIDFEDIEKVKYHKWRISHNHVVTGQPAKKQQRDVAHVVLGVDSRKTDKVVDHIDGNTFNNRKTNLRLITQSQNTKNSCIAKNNTSGFKGVYFDKKRNQWATEIRYNKKRIHFMRRNTKVEAVYQRLVAEKHLYKNFARESEIQKADFFTKDLSNITKNKIYQHVKQKLLKYNLWQ